MSRWCIFLHQPGNSSCQTNTLMPKNHDLDQCQIQMWGKSFDIYFCKDLPPSSCLLFAIFGFSLHPPDDLSCPVEIQPGPILIKHNHPMIHNDHHYHRRHYQFVDFTWSIISGQELDWVWLSYKHWICCVQSINSKSQKMSPENDIFWKESKLKQSIPSNMKGSFVLSATEREYT